MTERNGDRTVDGARHPYGAVTSPIVRSSTFTYPTSAEGARRFEEGDGLLYSRLTNPTVADLEDRVAELEHAPAAVTTASGMGAIHTSLMALLEPGARIVVDPCVYGCTWDLLQRLATWGVTVDTVDTTDTNALADALAPGADVVFVETPMNPSLRVVDLAHASDLAHDAGAHLLVDNTFATPAIQRPLDHGADLVVESLTKAMNGHGDLLAGAVAGDPDLLDEVRAWRTDAGPILDPETAWLVLRGMETLDVRVRAMTRSAQHVARTLDDLGLDVRHPSLRTHPDHDVAQRQMPRGTSVLTVDLATREAAFAFQDALTVFQRAVSLGGVESLVCHPATTTHAVLTDDARERAGITPGLVRLSVGVEPVGDLTDDVVAAIPRSLQG